MRSIFAALGLAALLGQAASADPVKVAPHPAPALAAGVWASGTPTTLAAQRGKVVVLLFWTHGCINCKHNLGYWNDWAKRYQNTDVAVLSVHTPETSFEYHLHNVRRFVRERGLRFPVLTDNSHRTWDAYQVGAWPTEILIDKQGVIRAQYEGELNWQGSGEYKAVQAQIEALRNEDAHGRHHA